ncbi:OB-fold-containig protein [Thalassomonas actiniarum]|uniref:DUF1449 family protein n=1 Tax=Thalassomonas actiniarum TaxID=485447 RepID=A0AAE9YRP0_9GAMM|nr:OB-fold-containig protein [Thalassomonas actiniarum]WDD99048.1 DUF1449 family protein [Thalassomonas actiniarum]
MQQVFTVASQFPTVIYTVLLAVVVIYWLVGMLGLIDLDFSGDVDVDIDADVDADASVGGLTGLLLTFGLTGVPFTLVISIIILVCWLISFYLQFYLLTWLPDGWLYYLAATAASFVVFLVSLPVTAILIRPLKGMFNSVETASSNNLVGKDATIATGSVTETFGQAKVFNDGAEILLDVRCDPQHRLSMGDKVLLIEYQQDSHTYIVAPFSG